MTAATAPNALLLLATLSACGCRLSKRTGTLPEHDGEAINPVRQFEARLSRSLSIAAGACCESSEPGQRRIRGGQSGFRRWHIQLVGIHGHSLWSELDPATGVR